MSTSMLNHIFGVAGIQYISRNFLAARPLSAAVCTETFSDVPTANLTMSLNLAKSNAPFKCCPSAVKKLNSSSVFPDYNAKTAGLSGRLVYVFFRETLRKTFWGFTMSLEGGLEELPEFFSSQAIFSSSNFTYSRNCLLSSTSCLIMSF